jgi:hypothetical protein
MPIDIEMKGALSIYKLKASSFKVTSMSGPTQIGFKFDLETGNVVVSNVGVYVDLVIDASINALWAFNCDI